MPVRKPDQVGVGVRSDNEVRSLFAIALFERLPILPGPRRLREYVLGGLEVIQHHVAMAQVPRIPAPIPGSLGDAMTLPVPPDVHDALVGEGRVVAIPTLKLPVPVVDYLTGRRAGPRFRPQARHHRT